jgi:hypothetical protein
MGTRLNQDQRRAVAQRIFAALCAHYPQRHIALFERPHADIGSPEPQPKQDTQDGTGSASL